MKSVINSSSSLFILISWSLLLLSSHCVVVGFSLNSEGEALLSLLNNNFSFESESSDKLDWNNLSSSSSAPCDWSGVGCNIQNTHVVSLNLSWHLISGQLGPRIGQLKYLKYLDLSYNSFNGSIPLELWNCSHLQYLDLSWNHGFSGKLPEAVKNLHQLNFFSISNNGLSGRIPVSLFQISGLKSVDLSFNNLTKIPTTELWNCSHLQHLDLSYNDFSGEFPHEAMRNLNQLKTFSIYNNQFNGRIPEYLFQNSGLEHVYLMGNNLTGPIPVNIGNATNMKILYLSNNQLHGSIPTSIANCTKLETLDLSNNVGGLSGEIPLGVWRIPTLSRIDVSRNNLSGELPVKMMTDLRLLTSISLSENQFFGSVPKDLGLNNNTNLKSVHFSSNFFTGEIPPNLCFGQKLSTLMLDQNQFHGNIPSSYTRNCDSLIELNLQGNKLTGSLPHFGQVLNNNTNSLVILDLSRNNIQGQIPSSICNLIQLQRLDLSENQMMNGTLPHCLGDINQLNSLILRSNNFSGTISAMNFTSALSMLDLNGNCFEGKIPRSLGFSSPFLEYLDLGNNQFNDTFPSFLDTLPSLDILVLRSNKLYGPLKQYDHPHSGYSSLEILDISGNYFSGNLPVEFILGLNAMKNIDKFEENSSFVHYSPISIVVIHKGKETGLNQTMMNTFRLIDMSNNRFQGSIPESIGELLVLTSLNLSNNNLNGRIPSSLGNLTRLESLDLSENKLFGEIPGQLTNLNFLAVLNLSHNNLTGHIPTAGQFQTYPNDSFVGNPGLCGYQSSTGCGGSHHRDPVVEKQSYKDSNSWSFGWEPVVIGYGCGVLIGLVLQYFIFTKASMYRWFG